MNAERSYLAACCALTQWTFNNFLLTIAKIAKWCRIFRLSLVRSAWIRAITLCIKYNIVTSLVMYNIKRYNIYLCLDLQFSTRSDVSHLISSSDANSIIVISEILHGFSLYTGTYRKISTNYFFYYWNKLFIQLFLNNFCS